MTSFILISPTPELGKKESLHLCIERAIDPLDITFLNPSSEKDGGNISLKIKDVHGMIEKASLKPIKSTMKAIILIQAELLTIPAQNALLKLLEEPPEHTILILETETPDALLPTIRSRCSIITLQERKESLPAEKKKILQTQIEQLTSQSIGDALKLAEQLTKKKDEALPWIKQMILYLRLEMLHRISKEENVQNYARNISTLLQAQKNITTTNANPRLLFEQLFLRIRANR